MMKSVHHRSADADDANGVVLMADLIGSLLDGDPAQTTVSMICRRICELAGFRFCGVLVPQDGRDAFRLAGGHGFPDEYVSRLHDLFLVHDDTAHPKSPTHQAAKERRTIANADMLEVPRNVPWRQFASDFGYRSMVSVPLLIGGEVIGVLNGYSSGRRDYDPAELKVIETLAAQAAVSLQISRLLESRQETIRRLEASNATLDRQRASLERGHAIHRELTSAAIDGKGPGAVAQTLADLLSRPVAVIRQDGTVAAFAELEDDTTGHTDLTKAQPRSGQSPDEDQLIAAAVRIPGEHLGHVAVARGAGEDEDLDRRAVEHAATILALDAVKERVVQATEDRLMADFFIDLFRGRISTDPETLRRAREHGLDPGGAYRVMLVRVRDAHPATQGRPAPSPGPTGRPGLLNRQGSLAAAVVHREISRTPGALAMGAGNTVTAVLPVDTEGNIDGRPARPWAEGLVGRLDEDLGRQGGQPIAVGVGTVADDLGQFTTSHADAELCLSFSKQLGRPVPVLVRDDLGLLGLFIDNRNPGQLLATAHDVLGPALDHDRDRAGRLVPTMTAYLDHDCDANRTAHALFVHPNTVRYRIRQAESLCDMNLRQPEDLLRARIATLTLTMLGQ